MNKPKPGELYRHFKGNLYRIVALAMHTETEEELVIYREAEGEKTYARPLEMFLSPVDKEKHPLAQQDQRFELILHPLAQQDQRFELISSGEEGGLDPEVEKFLDARTYQDKLDILGMLHHRIDDEMIGTMAMAIGVQVEEGPVEDRYQALKQSLLMLEKYECSRLR